VLEGSDAGSLLHGAELLGTYPLSVPIDGNALNITCNSYADQMAFGLTGCRIVSKGYSKIAASISRIRWGYTQSNECPQLFVSLLRPSPAPRLSPAVRTRTAQPLVLAFRLHQPRKDAAPHK